MKNITLLLIVLFLGSTAYSADIALFRNDIGAYPSALNGAASAEYGTAYSMFYNPAAPGYKPKASVSSTFFTIYETDIKELDVLFPTRWGTFSSALMYGSLGDIQRTAMVDGRPAPDGGSFGYGALKFLLGWSDTVSRFSPGIKEASKVSVGIQMEYLSETLDKAQGNAFLANIGALYALRDDLTAAVSYRNILAGQEQWGSGAAAQEQLDSYIRLGVKYSAFSDTLALNVDYPMVENGKLRAGLAYRVLPQLTLLLGTGDTSLSGGARLSLSGFYFDIAYMSAKHELLSSSYRFSLGYDLSGLTGQLSEEDEAAVVARYYNSSDTQTKILAVQSLADYSSHEAKDALIHAAKDVNRDVRKAAFKSLVQAYPEDAVVLLVDCLFEADTEIKALAAFYLGNIGNAEVLSVLEQILPFESNRQVINALNDSIFRLKSKL